MHQRHVISLLIHGFLSVNARLLIAFGTAFYAITAIIVKRAKKLEINNCHNNVLNLSLQTWLLPLHRLEKG